MLVFVDVGERNTIAMIGFCTVCIRQALPSEIPVQFAECNSALLHTRRNYRALLHTRRNYEALLHTRRRYCTPKEPSYAADLGCPEILHTLSSAVGTPFIFFTS
jgi:hypothetical protein